MKVKKQILRVGLRFSKHDSFANGVTIRNMEKIGAILVLIDLVISTPLGAVI